MNCGFTEEQELLRAEVCKFLDQRCPLDEVRKLVETPEGFSRELWKETAELGWLGPTIPPAPRGAGPRGGGRGAGRPARGPARRRRLAPLGREALRPRRRRGRRLGRSLPHRRGTEGDRPRPRGA